MANNKHDGGGCNNISKEPTETYVLKMYLQFYKRKIQTSDE